MILSISLIGLFLKGFQAAAQLSVNADLIDIPENSIVMENATYPCLKFEDLDPALQMKILSFLKYPHYNMAAVNKNFRDFFENVFPYNRVIAQQFGIPELGSSQFPKELRFFQELDYIPKELTKFHMLHNQAFNYDGFGNNTKYIALHVYNEYKKLTPEYKTSPNRVKMFDKLFPNVIGVFIKTGAYDFLAQMLENNPEDFAKGIGLFGIPESRNLLDLVIEKPPRMLDALIKHVTAKNNKSFIEALLLHFPIECYERLLLVAETQKYFYFVLVNLLIFVPIDPEIKEEVGGRIRNFLEFVNTKKSTDKLPILYHIRFAENPITFNLMQIKQVKFLLFAASITNQNGLIETFLKTRKSEMIKFIKEKPKIVPPKLLIDVLPHLTAEERVDFLNYSNNAIFRRLFDGVSVLDFTDLNEDSVVVDSIGLILKCNQELIIQGAPETFTLNTNVTFSRLIEIGTFASSETLNKFLDRILQDFDAGAEDVDVADIDADVEDIFHVVDVVDVGVINPRTEVSTAIFNSRLPLNQNIYNPNLFIAPKNEDGLIEMIKNAVPFSGIKICVPEEIKSSGFLLSQFKTSGQLAVLAGAFRERIVEMIQNAGDNVNYGEIREAVLYIFKKCLKYNRLGRIGTPEQLFFAETTNVELLKELAKDRPEIMLIRPELFTTAATEVDADAEITEDHDQNDDDDDDQNDDDDDHDDDDNQNDDDDTIVGNDEIVGDDEIAFAYESFSIYI